jgi:hypothetical protein
VSEGEVQASVTRLDRVPQLRARTAVGAVRPVVLKGPAMADRGDAPMLLATCTQQGYGKGVCEGVRDTG